MPPKSGEGRGEPFRILFVCSGNTCRSPMAEAVARAALARRGWSHVQVGSAGTYAGPGQPAAADAVAAAAEKGLDLGEHRSRQASAELLADQDLVLTMTASHVSALEALLPPERLELLGTFATGRAESVPDPIGQGLAVYRSTIDVLEEWVEAALDRLARALSP